MDLLSNYLDKLNKINSEYLKLCEMLTYEEVVLDSKLCQKLEKDKNALSPIANKFQSYQQNKIDIEEFKNIAEAVSQNEKNDIIKEITQIEKQQETLSLEIISLIDGLNAIKENIIILLQANNNSEELQQFIKNGYINFCKQHNLQLHESSNKNTIELKIFGLNAKQYFSSEIGIHKQSNTDCSCTIYVLDNISTEEFSFEEKDIKITICRSSGAGGQHINTTDSAVKITHLKSGISTICQSERSQFQNKEIALMQLKAKVTDFYQKQYEQHITKNRTKQYKSMNLKNITKTYDHGLKTIISKDKTISFESFLKGDCL